MSRLSISASFLVYCHLRCSLDDDLVKSKKRCRPSLTYISSFPTKLSHKSTYPTFSTLQSCSTIPLTAILFEFLYPWILFPNTGRIPDQIICPTLACFVFFSRFLYFSTIAVVPPCLRCSSRCVSVWTVHTGSLSDGLPGWNYYIVNTMILLCILCQIKISCLPSFLPSFLQIRLISQRFLLVTVRCKHLCICTYSLPIPQLPTSFLLFSPMLCINLFIGAPIFLRTSLCCLLSIPAFFNRAVAWCHHTFALLLLLRYF